MKASSYKGYDELPLMLSVPEAAAVLGISRAGAYELVRQIDSITALENFILGLRLGARITMESWMLSVMTLRKSWMFRRKEEALNQVLRSSEMQKKSGQL